MLLLSVLLVAAIYLQSITLTKCADCIDKMFEERFNDCCNMPQPFPLASLLQCARKIRQSHAASSHVIQNCKIECYYKELGILSDMTLNMDRVKLHLANMEDRAREFYEVSFQTCGDTISEDNYNSYVAMCSPFSALVDGCVQEKKNEHCPKEYLIESELCDQVKNGSKLCET